MRILIDTNALIRILRGEVLPGAARRILDRPGTELIVSIVTAWEIATKYQLGLSAGDVQTGILELSALALPVSFQHIQEYSRLPAFRHHRDPFDRMLIAQALAENMAIMTADSRFADYKKLRVIWD